MSAALKTLISLARLLFRGVSAIVFVFTTIYAFVGIVALAVDWMDEVGRRIRKLFRKSR